MQRRRIPRRVRGPGLPWKSFFALVGGLFLLIVVFGVGLDFVSDRVSLRAALIAREQSVLLDEVTQLEERNARLSEQVAVLERAQQIDYEAQAQLHRSYEARQKEIQLLNAELVFYKTVIDPAKRSDGVFVYSVKLASLSAPREYSYEIVLSQSPKRRYRIQRGVLNFVIDGEKDGKQQRLTLSDISSAELKELGYSFKYFQSIKGQIRLPKNFVPSQLVLEAVAKGSRKKGVEHKQPWSLEEGPATKGG